MKKVINSARINHIPVVRLRETLYAKNKIEEDNSLELSTVEMHKLKTRKIYEYELENTEHSHQ